MVNTNFLKNIEIFKGLDETGYTKLANITVEKTYKPGDYVVRKGDPSDALYILVEGICDVKIEYGDKKQFTIHKLNSGDVFGEIGFIDGRPRSADIVAVEPSKVVALHREVLWDFAKSNPEIGLKIMHNLTQEICERMRHTNEQFNKFYMKAKIKDESVWEHSWKWWL